MNLGQFERIERPPTRLATPIERPASKMPADGRVLGDPGIKWLVGWVFLFWFVLVLSVLPAVPIHRLFAPESASLRGFPGTDEWFRSSIELVLRWGATLATTAAAWALFAGSTLWLMLRSRVRGAKWLPLLAAVGAGVGTAVGYGFSVFIAFSDGGSYQWLNSDLFLLRQLVIVAMVGGAGSAVAVAPVLQPQIRGYGWWAAAWVVAFMFEALVGPVAILQGASNSEFMVASVLVGRPGFAIITGIATFYALKTVAPAEVWTAPSDAAVDPRLPTSVENTLSS